MSQPSAAEQYLLELINQERARAGAQPLAFDLDLNEAAENHSRWMIATGTFSHTGSGGSSPGQRMQSAGYAFSGSWSWGENIAWATTRAPAGTTDEVELLHANLMNSAGHRANLLSDGFREVGLGFEIGAYGGRESAFVTENFARSGTATLLTGVAFDDQDGDRRYDPGEGLGGLTVTAVSTTGARFTGTTMSAGGYDLALPAGSYSVTFSGAGIATTTLSTTLGARNVKLDLVDPAGGGTLPPPPPPTPQPETITGTALGDLLNGTAAADRILGLAGDDRILGGLGNDWIDGGAGNDSLRGDAGNDTLLGGDGRDVLRGSAGNDVLTGGAGPDQFVFDTAPSADNTDRLVDFRSVDDTIWLDDAVHARVGAPGQIKAAAFHLGAAAADAADRVVYDQSSGALLYDADGNGAGAAIRIALLTPGTALNASDIMIY